MCFGDRLTNILSSKSDFSDLRFFFQRDIWPPSVNCSVSIVIGSYSNLVGKVDFLTVKGEQLIDPNWKAAEKTFLRNYAASGFLR